MPEPLDYAKPETSRPRTPPRWYQLDYRHSELALVLIFVFVVIVLLSRL